MHPLNFILRLSVILTLTGPLVLCVQADTGAMVSVTGEVSSLDTDSGVLVLSDNGIPTLKVFLKGYPSILLWYLPLGQKLKVSGIENKQSGLPSITISSLDDMLNNISEISDNGTTEAWPNPIMVEGDPGKGITPMIAFTAPIRELAAKQDNDDLLSRYRDKVTAQFSKIKLSFGGHTGVPLDLEFFMSKDAVMQHLKMIDMFRVDSGNDNQLAYVVQNPSSPDKNVLYLTFDNDKLVSIDKTKTKMNKNMFDSYMLCLKSIANQWKTKGCKIISEDNSANVYIYKNGITFMSITGGILAKQPSLYSGSVVYTEQMYELKVLNSVKSHQ